MIDKSPERQVQDAEASLARLIAVANTIEEAGAAHREPTPTELAALEEVRHVFRLDLLGSMPLEAIKCIVIDPALAAPGVSDTAREAVNFAYEVLRLFETRVVPHADPRRVDLDFNFDVLRRPAARSDQGMIPKRRATRCATRTTCHAACHAENDAL